MGGNDGDAIGEKASNRNPTRSTERKSTAAGTEDNLVEKTVDEFRSENRENSTAGPRIPKILSATNELVTVSPLNSAKD